MASTTNATAPRVVPLRPAAPQRPLDREAALRQVRSARRHVQSRQERFAHLKRSYD